MPIITLTTDFGQRDWFVGAMKGVILGLSPQTRIVDITHEIPPGDIRAGAFALAASSSYFPKGTVHVAVIDPGVGTQRKPIAVETRDYLFVGPDNGVLSWALRSQSVSAAYVLENESLFVRPVSRTFHGRDIFAPVAARLSLGLAPHKVGQHTTEYQKLDWPEPRLLELGIQGEVVYVDQFGNLITNIEARLVQTNAVRNLTVYLGTKRLCSVKDSYGAVRLGSAVGVFGSSGYLEIAVNRGNAATKLQLGIGAKVTIR